MENPRELGASSFPLRIKLGDKRIDRYSFDDFQPSTPPGDVEFTSPPTMKPRRSKYRGLLGEHLEIPEKNEQLDQSSSEDESNISLNIVPSSKYHSYRLPERDNSGQKPDKISAEVIKHQFTAQPCEVVEAQPRNFENTPSSDAMLLMLQKASIARKPMQKSNSHSDLQALKNQNVMKDETDSIPHVHTEECRLEQTTFSNSVVGDRRSSSTTDLVTSRRSELRQMHSQMYAQIKTRFTASAEAVRSMQERNKVESQTPVAVSPVAQPELHKQSLFGKFVNWGTSKTLEIGNRDANVLGPSSF